MGLGRDVPVRNSGEEEVSIAVPVRESSWSEPRWPEHLQQGQGCDTRDGCELSDVTILMVL